MRAETIENLKPTDQRAFFSRQFGIAQEVQAKSTRIIRFFPQADLRCQHLGLAKVAASVGINVHKLAPGEFVIFLNNARDKLKMYASGNVLAYLKMPQGTRVDLNVIQHIPRFFSGGKINYDAALKKQIKRELDRVIVR